MRERVVYCYDEIQATIVREILKSFKAEFYSYKKDGLWTFKYEVTPQQANKPSRDIVELLLDVEPGTKVADFKAKNNLTYRELADVFGVNQATMSYWLSFGTISIEFIKVLKNLGFDVSEFKGSQKLTHLYIQDERLLKKIAEGGNT